MRWAIITSLVWFPLFMCACSDQNRATGGASTAAAPVFADDFAHDLSHWTAECERPARIEVQHGVLTIDTKAGCTLWLKQKLTGPLVISYDVRAVSAGGINDRVSDVNCFWMATDARNAADFFAVHRTGKFTDYNPLRCYYVGVGGNTNSTTRFRRYIGDPDDRPLLKENDLRDPTDLLIANQWQTLRIVANNHLIQFFRGQKKLFELNDPDPYRAGYFAFRTTQSHLEFRNFKVQKLNGFPGERIP